MSKLKNGNFFSKIPKSIPKELFETIVSSNDFKIEKIISKGHKTKKDYWYDQDNNESVLILNGSAELLFENEELIKMKEGEYIIIPAHKKHRVEKTDEKKETIWLTIFYK